MRRVRCEYCKKRFDGSVEKCPFCGTEHVAYKEGDSRLTWFRAHRYSVQNAPFMRFLARVIDVLLVVLLLEALFGRFLANYMGGTTALQILLPASALFQTLLEPIFLAQWGYTPGKRVLNIAVRNLAGEKKTFLDYFRRSFSVFFWGFGLLLPVVSLFTLYFSYVRVSHGEPTHWDENKETIVLQKKFSIWFAIIAVALIVVECYLFFELSHQIFSFHDSMIRNQ